VTRTRMLSAIVLAASALALPACGSSDSAAPAADSPVATEAAEGANAAGGGGITIKDFGFSAGSGTAGQPITIINDDGPTHTVTADDGSFDVKIAGGETGQITVAAAGTFAFHCNIHPSMKGSLTVA
jgi:plastocyanin